MRCVMATFYLVAGTPHIRAPEAFLPVVPEWVPAPREVVLFTGGCEVVGALSWMTRQLRLWAGIMLALYDACVFPREHQTRGVMSSCRDCRQVGGGITPRGQLSNHLSCGGRYIVQRS
jgi:hypothetical protein